MHTQKLVDRMLTYDGLFDGYPSMSEADVGLILQASGDDNPIVVISYLASEYAKTPDQLTRARAYLNDYVQNVWVCNMMEGENPVFVQG